MTKRQNEIRLTDRQLPPPGEDGVIKIGDYEIYIYNNADPSELRRGDVVGYRPVAVQREAGTVSHTVHAAAVVQAASRTRRQSLPLCNRDGKSKVVGDLKGQEVTCQRCLTHLRNYGFIE